MGRKKTPVDNTTKVKINGKLLEMEDPSDLLQQLLMSVKVKYSPYEAIKRNLNEIFDFFIEYCEDKRQEVKGEQRSKLTKFMNSVTKYKETWFEKDDPSVVITKYYNLLLGLQNLGTLPGFGGCTRFGDKLYGDPEKMLLEDMWARI